MFIIKFIQASLVAAFSLLLISCTPTPSSSWSGYVEGEYLYISSPIGGRIESLHVKAGQEVAKDVPLFNLDNQAEQAGRDEAAARVLSANAQAANISKGKRSEEIKVIQSQLNNAKTQSTLAKSELGRLEKLVAQGFISQSKLDDAKTAFQLSQGRVTELEASLKVAQLPARSDERDVANANAQAAEQMLKLNDWKTAQKSVTAPQAGLIADVFFRAGEVVNAGQAVLSLLPPDNIKLRFFIPESQLGSITVGQSVSIHCDACTNPITAHITRISSQAEYTPPMIYSNAQKAKLVFMVEARPDQAQTVKLHPGQPIEVTPSTTAEKKS